MRPKRQQGWDRRSWALARDPLRAYSNGEKPLKSLNRRVKQSDLHFTGIAVALVWRGPEHGREPSQESLQDQGQKQRWQ